MYLGEQMKESETIKNEYKEFCIKTNIYNYYTQCELNDVIKTGKLPSSFNNMIIDNLKLYCNIYVPKYASSFTNSKIQNGNIQIGVNDNGEITGVPFHGELNEAQLSKLVARAKEKYLLKTEHEVKTTIKITKLKIHNQLINDNTDEIVRKTKKHNQIYKLIQYNYYNERQKWVEEVLKYSVKLSDIVKNKYTRLKFYNWLKKQKCQMYNKIIQTNSKTIENINNKRQLISNEKSIIHWIAMYKDETMTNLQSMKPENPNITKLFNSSVYLMTYLTHMRKKLLENNNNLNYYKIDIIFDIKLYQEIVYKKINKHLLYKSFRKFNELGPYSETLVI